MTGASKNIGRAIALRLAQQGADVVLHASSESEDLSESLRLVQSAGRQAWAYAADFSEPGAALEFGRAVCDEHQISILVNNAAIRPAAAYDQIGDSDWEGVLRVNLQAPFQLVQRVAPQMLEAGWGRVINIGGQDSAWGWGDRAHVVASKAGLLGLTRCLAVELGDGGVTVNSVIPGLIDTSRDGRNYQDWTQVEQRLTAAMAIRSVGHPEDIAAAVGYLASDSAGFVTGQELHVNGGGYPLLRNPRTWSVD